MHRRTASKRIVTDGETLAEIDQLTDTLKLAKLAEAIDPQGLASEVPVLERRILELAEKAAAESTLFTVGALPAVEYDEIKRQHPPTAEQLERYQIQAKVQPWVDMPEMDWVGMTPDLLVACLIEPEWDESTIREYWAGLSKGQQIQLWNLAYGVQLEGSELPFYAAATGTIGGGGEPSTTPANGASPSRST